MTFLDSLARFNLETCCSTISLPDVAFWKSPTGGVIVAIASYLAKTAYDQRQQRLKLLDALLAEVTTSRIAIEEIAEDFPSYEEATKIVESVKSQSLPFDVLTCLPSGFTLFPPSFSYSELVTRLRSDEARAAIEYVDAWARFVDLEKRYAASFLKLVDLTPHITKLDNSIQVLEIAHQVRGYLRQLRRVLMDLDKARYRIACLACSRTTWVPQCLQRTSRHPIEANLRFHEDWTSQTMPNGLTNTAIETLDC